MRKALSTTLTLTAVLGIGIGLGPVAATAGEDGRDRSSRADQRDDDAASTSSAWLEPVRLSSASTPRSRTRRRRPRGSPASPATRCLVGIDYRVQNGALYGVGIAGGLYMLNPNDAVATKVGQLSVALSGTNFGVDFNPAANALRVISDNGPEPPAAVPGRRRRGLPRRPGRRCRHADRRHPQLPGGPARSRAGRRSGAVSAARPTPTTTSTACPPPTAARAPRPPPPCSTSTPSTTPWSSSPRRTAVSSRHDRPSRRRLRGRQRLRHLLQGPQRLDGRPPALRRQPRHPLRDRPADREGTVRGPDRRRRRQRHRHPARPAVARPHRPGTPPRVPGSRRLRGGVVAPGRNAPSPGPPRVCGRRARGCHVR